MQEVQADETTQHDEPGPVGTIDVSADTVEHSETSCQPAPQDNSNVDLVMRIPVSVDVVLGSASMPVSRLMRLGRGSVVALDRKVGEPVDLVVNGRTIARGEVVLMEDGSSKFGISLTEIVNAASPVTSSSDGEA